MAEPSPRRQRVMRIEVLKAEATRLFAAAGHETLRDQVRIAIGDLDEAFLLLNRLDAESAPSMLAVADLDLHLASTRLQKVQEWLCACGPDAALPT